MKKLIIWGAGGHGKVVLDVARAMDEFTEIVFLDDAAERCGKLFCGCRIMGGREQLGLLKERGYRLFVAAIGDNWVRARCYEQAQARGLAGATLVHPSATVSLSARIGHGTVVMPRAVINAEAQVGENVVVNTGAILEHDCVVGDHAHLSPGAVAGGGTNIRAFAQLGMGAVALPGAEIGEGAVAGAGAVVLDSIPPGVIAVGVPARPLERRWMAAAAR